MNCLDAGTKRATTSKIMSLDKYRPGLRRNIPPITVLLLLIFEWQMSKGVISPPVNVFPDHSSSAPSDEANKIR